MGKIIASPALWAFVGLCLAFNALLIVDCGSDEYAEYVAQVSEACGVELGTGFRDRLAALPGSDFRELLGEQVASLGNVFEGYDTSSLAEAYIDKLGLEGDLARAMREKYAKLQEIVDGKARAGDALSLYFAGSTYWQHDRLFGSVMNVLCIQGIPLAVLTMLFTIGHENANRTEGLVYSSKTGRRIVAIKAIAAVAVAAGLYSLLAWLTLCLHFALNGYGKVLASNVSSAFNFINDLVAGIRAFITWHSFTIAGYLWASLGLTIALMFCFSLAGFVAGTCIRNSYLAFVAVFLSGSLCVFLPVALPMGWMKFALSINPVWIWLRQPLWFTDGGMDIFWPNFEVLGICVSLGILSVCAMFAGLAFRKKALS